MTSSDKMTEAEDRLEKAARKADASFKERTAGAEKRLEQAEDRAEEAARKAEASFKEHRP